MKKYEIDGTILAHGFDKAGIGDLDQQKTILENKLKDLLFMKLKNL